MAQQVHHSDAGRFLKRQRKCHHLTQVALGHIVGLCGETIRAYESGKRRIQQTWIKPLAAALHLSPEETREWQLLVQREAEARKTARQFRRH